MMGSSHTEIEMEDLRFCHLVAVGEQAVAVCQYLTLLIIQARQTLSNFFMLINNLESDYDFHCLYYTCLMHLYASLYLISFSC